MAVSNGNGHGARALDHEAVAGRGEPHHQRSVAHRRDDRPGLGGRRRADALARQRVGRTEPDGGVAQGDRRRRPDRSPRPPTVSCRRSTRWRPPSSRSRASSESLTGFVRQTAAAIQQSNDSIQRTTATAKEMATPAQQVTTSMTQITASVKSTTADTAVADLVGQRDGRGDRGDDAIGAGRRDQRRRPGRSGEETSSAINETAASIEEVTAMVDSLAATDRAERRVHRAAGQVGAERRAERQRISDAAGRRRDQRDRSSIAPVSRSPALAKEADEITRRASQEAKEGGASVQRSIQGFARVKDSMTQSADGHPRDGQAGQRDQQHRGHHRPDCRAHQSAVAERVDRGGARRRCGPGIRRRGRGDSQPGGSLGEGDLRHRRHHQGAAGSGARSGRRLQRRAAGRRSKQHAGGRGRQGLGKILDGVTEATPGRGQIARASDEQREARTESSLATITSTAEQARHGGRRDRGTGHVGDHARADERPGSEDRRTRSRRRWPNSRARRATS